MPDKNLEVSHFVVNGDSFTYCQNLYCPPLQGWPALVANNYKLPIVNLAVPGIGNDTVLRKTYEYVYKNLKFNNKPFFIIALANSLRFEEYFLKSKSWEILQINTIPHNKIAELLYRECDNTGIGLYEIKKLIYMDAMINLFETYKIPYLFTDYCFDGSKETTDFLKNQVPELYHKIRNHQYKLDDFANFTRDLPKALDNGHDGEEAQRVLKDYITSKINEIYGNIIPVKTQYYTLSEYLKVYDTHFMGNNQWYHEEAGLPTFTGIKK